MLSLLLPAALASDPAGSWLAYAAWTNPKGTPITYINTTWTVPQDPAVKFGSNAPGFWYGIQTSDGDGALIQPILAYGYRGAKYSIFNACFDWTDSSWTTSDEVYTVAPGDLITSSITYAPSERAYTMVISSANLGKTITTKYALKAAQTKPETTAYFVVEHQPAWCRAYPSSGVAFQQIHVEVDNALVPAPAWKAALERPKCGCKATVVTPQEIVFNWNTTDSVVAPPGVGDVMGPMPPPPHKWGLGVPSK
jgi:hypothetical protein